MKVSDALLIRQEMARFAEASVETMNIAGEFEKELQANEVEIIMEASDIIRKKLWSPRRHTLESIADVRIMQ